MSSSSNETYTNRPQRRSRTDLPKSRRKLRRSSAPLNSSSSQPPRQYLSHSKSTVSLRSCPPCLVRVSCVTRSPLTRNQAVKVRAALLGLAAVPALASSLRDSRHSPTPRAFNRWRPISRDQSLTSPTLMTLFRQSFLSTANHSSLTLTSSLLICHSLSLRRGAGRE